MLLAQNLKDFIEGRVGALYPAEVRWLLRELRVRCLYELEERLRAERTAPSRELVKNILNTLSAQGEAP